MRAQRAPSRPRCLPPDFAMLCMPGFLRRSDGDYPCVGQHISRRKNARRLSPSDLRKRCQIYALLQSGHSQAHIARQIGVDPSTISRELVRNTGARGYRFKQAHEKASQRREEASDKPRKMTPDLVELIEEKLTQKVRAPLMLTNKSRLAQRSRSLSIISAMAWLTAAYHRS